VRPCAAAPRFKNLDTLLRLVPERLKASHPYAGVKALEAGAYTRPLFGST
jgi:hypothetical protein